MVPYGTDQRSAYDEVGDVPASAERIQLVEDLEGDALSILKGERQGSLGQDPPFIEMDGIPLCFQITLHRNAYDLLANRAKTKMELIKRAAAWSRFNYMQEEVDAGFVSH